MSDETLLRCTYCGWLYDPALSFSEAASACVPDHLLSPGMVRRCPGSGDAPVAASLPPQLQSSEASHG